MSEERLSLDMIQEEAKTKEKKFKRVEVKVGKKTAIVKIAQQIDSNEKIEILQRAVDLATEGMPEEVAIMLATMESTTNIDFPSTLTGRLTLLEYLEETDQLEKVFKALPEEELEGVLQFIHKTSEGIKTLSEQGHLDEGSKFVEMLKKEDEKEKEKE